VGGHTARLIAGSSREPAAVVSVNLHDGRVTALRRSAENVLESEWISEPEAIEYPTSDGARAHGFFYAPMSPRARAPAGERPPVIVLSHGGPTGATSTMLEPRVQYWTTRGFAVMDVNYRGSTGYGRAYRDALRGRWGVVDVEDCVHAAGALVDDDRVDVERLIIRGGSAGGYTTLAALAFHDRFCAGASHYGVSDLEALARDTHKFESRYLDWLIGPYPGRRDLYRARSPLYAAARLSCPVIFFQGLEDAVVPPAQAEAMVAALRAKGVPVAYLAFEGEQHGFRKATTLRTVLEAELEFYGRVLGFRPADELPDLDIANL
jgi:dipeptidyl aminopeptidase/acylaminoacyl peptidase